MGCDIAFALERGPIDEVRFRGPMRAKIARHIYFETQAALEVRLTLMLCAAARKKKTATTSGNKATTTESDNKKTAKTSMPQLPAVVLEST